ncbi:MAG: hypothetical protein IH899_21580, partial [Planctomycetes bacterium]|nr:hypothetical protein [Planctomycetota bacterium]
MDIDSILDDWDELRERGEHPPLDQFLSERFPGVTDSFRAEVKRRIEAVESMDRVLAEEPAFDPHGET